MCIREICLFFVPRKDVRRLEGARLSEGERLFFRTFERCVSTGECALIRGCASIRRNSVGFSYTSHRLEEGRLEG